MKGIFFHRFDKEVHAEPWELENTLICQIWHVGRLRVNKLTLLSELGLLMREISILNFAANASISEKFHVILTYLL